METLDTLKNRLDALMREGRSGIVAFHSHKDEDGLLDMDRARAFVYIAPFDAIFDIDGGSTDYLWPSLDSLFTPAVLEHHLHLFTEMDLIDIDDLPFKEKEYTDDLIYEFLWNETFFDMEFGDEGEYVTYKDFKSFHPHKKVNGETAS